MKKTNLIWGLFFIASAIAVILNQTGTLGHISIWTLLISIALVPAIVISIIHKNFSGIFIPLAIYAILFAQPLGIEKFTPWPVLGAAIFLSIGFTLIFPHKHHKHHNHIEDDSPEHWKENGATVDNVDSEDVLIRTRYSGSVKYITSQNLKTANIECSFGGIKVFLDEAKLSNGKATINVYLSFGGMDLYIPKDWKVINDVRCTFGGAEEKGLRNYESDENTIVLTGNVKFSGISIIRV